MIKKLTAEFLGTFVLVAAGTGAVAMDASVFRHLTCFRMCRMEHDSSFREVVGGSSQSRRLNHFRSSWKAGKKALLPYLLSQCLGATAGALLVYALNEKVAAGLTLPSEQISSNEAFGIEVGITFVLMFTILRAPCLVGSSINRIALLVGTTVGVNAYLFGPMTGASMNPARTLGPALVAGNLDYLWLYLFATVLGVTVALAIHKAIPPKQAGCC